MGTSKAYGGLKGVPTWSNLSSSVTKAVNDGHPTQDSLRKIMSNAVAHFGGSNRAYSGGSKTGGRASVKTAQRLGSFLGNVQNNGFISSLNGLGKGIDINDVSQAKGIIIEHCANNAGTLDEVAAKAAMRDLLNDIGADALSINEFGEKFESAIKDYGPKELIVKYFGNYLYEHLATDFYEKLIKEKGIKETNSFYRDLKEYIIEQTKTISENHDLRSIDWQSRSGQTVIQELFRETLIAFEGYED